MNQDVVISLAMQAMQIALKIGLPLMLVGLIADDAVAPAGDTILLPAETVEKARPGFLESLRKLTVIK